MKNRTCTQRHRFVIRLGTVGMALIFSLGMPAASGIGPVPVSEVSAQWPEDQFRLCFWNIELCVGSCVPGYGLCCGDSLGPIF